MLQNPILIYPIQGHYHAPENTKITLHCLTFVSTLHRAVHQHHNGVSLILCLLNVWILLAHYKITVIPARLSTKYKTMVISKKESLKFNP